jgi:hypothetical protein
MELTRSVDNQGYEWPLSSFISTYEELKRGIMPSSQGIKERRWGQ